MPRKSKKQIEEERQSSRLAWVVISILSGVLIFFTVSKMGVLGSILNNVLVYLLGSLYIVPLVTLFGYGLYTIFNSKDNSIFLIIGLFVVNMAVIVLSAYITNDIVDFTGFINFVLDNFLKIFDGSEFNFTGGLLGSLLYVCLLLLIDRTGTLITIIVLFIISLILIIPVSTYKEIFTGVKDNIKDAKQEKKKRKQEEELLAQKAEEERKQRLAEKMALEAEKELADLQIKQENEIVDEEVVEERRHVDTYSTNSKFLINLTDSELNKGVVKSNKKPSSINVSVNTPQETHTKIHHVVKNNGSYSLPKPYDMFLDKVVTSNSNVNKTSAKLKGEKVIEILRNFGIEASLINNYIGPSVTKFEIKPDSSVKVNKIMNISDNIKMELAAKDIRIEAPIPGRSAVGIEIPNVEAEPVKMLDIVRKIPKDLNSCELIFALGKDLMGKPIYCDIAKMPHLLIAGATGSGKSVCINSLIISMLLRTNPDDVKLVLVDPKKVEFTPYKDIPHLLWPIIDDAQMASNMLKKIVTIMEDRYDAFSTVGVKNIVSYNDYVSEYNAKLKSSETRMNKLPYICVIIDELADLMLIAGKDVEASIQRITQLARASGIHLVVATQRPSTDVITGLIKSNIPSRISFAVASSIDSRTILDQTGAERLLGNGDMLYYPQGENAPIRLQGVFVSDKEIQKVTSYVKSQAKPEYEDSYFEFLTNMNGTTVMSAGLANADSMDSLYDDVVEFVKIQQKASTSLLQRRFGIGYNRAARLIDTLEDRGIIGPSNGSKPREVYAKPDEE